MNNNKYFTVKQVAARFNRCEMTVYRWIYKGILPAYKVIDGWLIKESDMLKLIKPAPKRLNIL